MRTEIFSSYRFLIINSLMKTVIFFCFLLFMAFTVHADDSFLDTDNDGLTDIEESYFVTSIISSDTDNDGVVDLWDKPNYVASESPLNEYVTDNQENPACASNGSGYMVVWDSYSQYQENVTVVCAKMVDTYGQIITPEFCITPDNDSSQSNASIASDGEKYFVVWDYEVSTGNTKILGRFYDDQGNPIGDVKELTGTNCIKPAMAYIGNGINRYLLVYTGNNGKDGDEIYGRLLDNEGNNVVQLDNEGNPIPAEIHINTYQSSTQTNVGVATNGSNFCVVWQSQGQDGSEKGIYALFIDSDGVKAQDSEFKVNTYIYSSQYEPSLASDGKNYFVAWSIVGQDYPEHGIYGQLFSASGEFIGTEFRVNTVNVSHQRQANISSNGINYMVSWKHYYLLDGVGQHDIRGQLFDKQGKLIGAEFTVNKTINDDQQYPCLASDGKNYYCVWQSSGQDGSGFGVYGGVVKWGYATEPLIADTDNDGLSDGDEIYQYRTDPLKLDSDNDLINDNLEVLTYNTNPNSEDTDNDGMVDSWEIDYGLLPVVDDSMLDNDNDGLTNYEEYIYWSAPNLIDTDNDGKTDLYEIQKGSNPADPIVIMDYDNDWLIEDEEIFFGTLDTDIDTDNDGVMDVWDKKNYVGDEIRINERIEGTQNNPSVASNGENYFVVWEGYGGRENNTKYGIYGTILDLYGNRVRLDFQISPSKITSQLNPYVCTDGENYFVVWEYVQASDGKTNIKGQFYDRFGNKIGAVKQLTGATCMRPSIAYVGSGIDRYLLVYNGKGEDEVYGRLLDNEGNVIVPLDNEGNPLPVELHINTYRSYHQRNLNVVSNGSTFFVVWQSAHYGRDNDIHGRLLDPNGNFVTDDFIISTYNKYNQALPAVSSDGNNYLVVWTSNPNYNDSGIYAQLINSTGELLNTEFRISILNGHNKYNPVISYNGVNYMVSWHYSYRLNNITQNDVVGQLIDKQGKSIGNWFTINKTLELSQKDSCLASDGSNFYCAWQSLSQDGNSWGVYGSVIKWGYATDSLVADTDNDGLSDGDEIYQYRTDPLKLDSDNDLINDNLEVLAYITNPNSEDTDNDGMVDSWEIDHGLLPTIYDSMLDTDNDGLTNYEEYIYWSNPNLIDTDNDGNPDLYEIQNGSNPADPVIIIDYDNDWLTLDDENFLGTFDTKNDTDNDGVADTHDIKNYPAMEVRLNERTEGTQNNPSVASNGENYFAVWEGYGGRENNNTYGIYGTILDLYGNRLRLDFEISPLKNTYQMNPYVCTNGENYFVVWEWVQEDGHGSKILGQFYDRNGEKISEVKELSVSNRSNPSLAYIGGNIDRYLLVYHTSQSTQYEVYARLLDNEGNHLASEFRVNTYITSGQFNPAVASNGSNFLVVWQSSAQDYSWGYGVYGQFIDAEGLKQGDEFRVNTFTLENQERSVVASDGENYLVVWYCSIPNYITVLNKNYSSLGIYGQLIDDDGSFIGSEFRIPELNTTVGYPAISSNGASYMIGWYRKYSRNNVTQNDIVGRLVDKQGELIGDEFFINKTWQGDQDSPCLSSDGENYYCAWQSSGQDGSSWGVYGTRINWGYATDPLIADTDNDGLLDGDEIHQYQTNPLKADSDNDLINDNLEVLTYNTNPNSEDTDNDGMVDLWEIDHGLLTTIDDSMLDADNDGLSNYEEYIYWSNPDLFDTDNDGIIDLYEIQNSTNPSEAVIIIDYDNDWLTLDDENFFGTLDTDNDTDNDGVLDSHDIENYPAMEVRLNERIESTQNNPSVASNGKNYFAVWEGYGGRENNKGYGIYGTILDLYGNRLRLDFQISPLRNIYQMNPYVCTNGENYFVVWEWVQEDGHGSKILGQFYDSYGEKLGSLKELSVSDRSLPSVAYVGGNMDRYLLVYQSVKHNQHEVYARLLDNEGDGIVSEFLVNTYTNSNQEYAAVSSNGLNFLVAWQSPSQDGSGSGVYGQFIDAEGVKQGAELRINGYTVNEQKYPAVTSDGENYLVAWYGAGSGVSCGMFGRLIDDNGSFVGNDFHIDKLNNESQGRVSLASNGFYYIATWHHRYSLDNVYQYDIIGQLIDRQGKLIGNGFTVNITLEGDQTYSSIASDGENYYCAWQSSGQDGSSWGVYGTKINWGYGTSPTNTDSDNDGKSDYFEIQQGTNPIVAGLSIIYPIQNHLLAGGSDINLEWSLGDFIGQNITVEFSSDSGETWDNEGLVTAADLSFIWTIPDINSETAKLRISGYSLGIFDMAQVDVRIDNIHPEPPVITYPATNTSDVSYVDVQGTKEPYASVWKTVDGVQTKIVNSNSSVSWSYRWYLVQGGNTIEFYQVDQAGNQSATQSLNISYTPLPMPVNLSVNASGTGEELRVYWSGYNENLNNISAYRVYIQSDEGAYINNFAQLEPVDTVNRGIKQYHFRGLQRDELYYVAVVGVGPGGEYRTTTPPYNHAVPRDIVPPADATGLVITAQTTTSFTLTWDHSSDFGNDLAGYRIYTDSSGKYEFDSQVANDVTSVVFNKKIYRAVVTAIDTSGNESDGSEVVRKTLLPDPSGLQAVQDGYDIRLNWAHILDRSTLDAYVVYASKSSFTFAESSMALGYETSGREVLLEDMIDPDSNNYYEDWYIAVTSRDLEQDENLVVSPVHIRIYRLLSAEFVVEASEINFSKSPADLGEEFVITTEIANMGQIDADNVTVAFYEFDEEIGRVVVDSIPNGKTRTVSIPNSTSQGLKLIGVVVDPDKEFDDIDDNNRANKILQVGYPTDIGAEIYIEAGNKTVRAGTGCALGGSACYDFDVVPGFKDFPVQGAQVSVTVMELDNETEMAVYTGGYTNINGNFSQSFFAPKELGTYIVKYSISDNTVTTDLQRQLIVVEDNRTDVRIFAENISFIPENPASDQQFTFTARVFNTGSNPAEGMTVYFYQNDVWVSDERIESLMPGDNDSVSITYSADEGYYVMAVEVELDNTSMELNPNNNAATKAIKIGNPSQTPVFYIKTSQSREIYASRWFGANAKIYYDFPGIFGSEDYEAKGIDCSFELIRDEIKYISTESKTDRTGSVGFSVLAPGNIGLYSGIYTANDGILETSRTTSFTLTEAPLVEYRDVSVRSGHILFDNDTPESGDIINLYAMIDYSGSVNPPEGETGNVVVRFNDIYPIGNQLSSFKVDETSVTFPETQLNSTVVTSVGWEIPTNGAHIIQVETYPDFPQRTDNDKSTRLIYVGNEEDNLVHIEKRQILWEDSDGNSLYSPGDTVKYVIAYRNKSDQQLTGFEIFDLFDTEVYNTPTEISDSGYLDSTGNTEETSFNPELAFGSGEQYMNVVVWNIGVLEGNEEGIVEYKVEVKDIDVSRLSESIAIAKTDQTDPVATQLDETFTINYPPVAKTKKNLFVYGTGSIVQLDGTKSIDVEGDPFVYQWVTHHVPSGSSAELDNDQSPTPVFIADMIGAYSFELFVFDSLDRSDSTLANVYIYDSESDIDGDGVTDEVELLDGINPLDSDTDNDSIEDGMEKYILHSNPKTNDSDNDGLLDNEEKEMYFTSLTSSDTDNDGLSDSREISLSPVSQQVSTSSDKNLKRASVASNGNISIVLWDCIKNNGLNDDVIARRIDNNGISVGNPFVLNQYKPDDQCYCDIASSGETFFAVWENEKSDGLSYQLFDNEGNLVGDEQFLVEEFNREYLDVCAGADGVYLICYPVLGRYDFDLKGCLFNSKTQQVIKSFNITSSIGNDNKPSACFYGDGYFVAWQREKPDGSHDVFAVLIDNDGNMYVDEMRVNTTCIDNIFPSVTSDNTTICVVWESLKDDGKTEVRARLIYKNGVKLNSEIVLKTDDIFSYHNPEIASNGIYYALAYFRKQGDYSSVQYEILDSTLLNSIRYVDMGAVAQNFELAIVYNQFDLILAYNQNLNSINTFYAKVNSCTSPTNNDTDNDGLSDFEEFSFPFSNPKSNDTDGDLLSDTDELLYHTRLLSPDSDNDGLADGYEVLYSKTNPLLSDSDNDGMNDGFEIMFNFNPNKNIDSGFDNDGDGITNLDEYVLGYDPLLLDTDNDGLSDGYELQNGSSALLADTDGDGLIDGDELSIGTSIISLDSDNDGINDFDEIMLYFTDPLLPDYDGDGLTDGEEVIQYNDIDFKLNTDYHNITRCSLSAATNGLNLAVVWLNCKSTLAETISLCVYDKNFQPYQNETIVVSILGKDNKNPLIASNGANYMLIWLSTSPENGLYAQCLNSNGGIDGDQFTVNTDYQSIQLDPPSSIASDGTNYLVIYMTSDDGDSSGIIGYIYDSSGNIVKDEFAVNSQTQGEQKYPVSCSNGANYLVVWKSEISNDYSIKGQLFNTGGVAIGSEILLNTSTTQLNGSLCAASNGITYLVAWKENNEIRGQLLFTDGTKKGLLFIVGDMAESVSINNVSVCSNGGSYLVCWHETDQLDDSNIYGQFFDGLGNKIGNKFCVNRYKDSKQLNCVAAAFDSTFFVAWEDSRLSKKSIFANFISGMSMSDPLSADTDNDGMDDWIEYFNGISPQYPNFDTDNDGIRDSDELTEYKTNHLLADTDGDNLNDYYELFVTGTEPCLFDTDNDSLSDDKEIYDYSTNPLDNDTDGDELNDGDEVYDYHTNPLDNDSDNDGMHDGWEVKNGLNPIIFDADNDPDNDTLSNIYEYEKNTNPTDPDTDDDGLSDFVELFVYDTKPREADTDKDGLLDGEEVNNYKTSPVDPDTDDDGLSDYEEIENHGSDPLSADSDNDGMPDGWEKKNGTNINFDDAILDYDNDGLSNIEEFQYGHNIRANKPDSDFDGLSDYEEIKTYYTKPTVRDSDGDGIFDGWEVLHNLQPMVYDSDEDPDNDGLSNLGEWQNNGDPFVADTDNDGLSDGEESFLIGEKLVIGIYDDRRNTGLSVASNGDNFLCVWLSKNEYGDDPFILAKFLDGSSMPISTDFQINDMTGMNFVSPCVTSDDNNYFIAWQSMISSIESFGIRGKIVDGEGTTYSDEYMVDDSQNYETICTVASNGSNYLFVWQTYDVEENKNMIYARKIGLDGQPAGESYLINNLVTTLNQRNPIITFNSYVYLVVWEGFDGEKWQIYGQYLNNNGEQIDSEFKISKDSDANQIGIDAVVQKNDSFFVTYKELGGYYGKYVNETVTDDTDMYLIDYTEDIKFGVGGARLNTNEHKGFLVWFDDEKLISSPLPEISYLDIKDSDNDGLLDGDEKLYNTSPRDNDSDDDGLYDKDEIVIYNTRPDLYDTDNDELSDGEEIFYNTSPNDIDTDTDGLTDYQEIKETGTDPNRSDHDNDGLIDSWEYKYGLNLFENDSQNDPDNDGLVNITEYSHNTSPISVDTDNDGLTDFSEINVHHTSPINTDTDNDGLNDYSELDIYGSEPLVWDTDNDGMRDGWEVENQLNLLDDDSNFDPDNDQVSNLKEFQYNSNPNMVDTDNDGLSDYDEIEVHNTNPSLKDTDKDGSDDPFELRIGTNPTDKNSFFGIVELEPTQLGVVVFWKYVTGKDDNVLWSYDGLTWYPIDANARQYIQTYSNNIRKWTDMGADQQMNGVNPKDCNKRYYKILLNVDDN